jgi:hypothetical protein
MKREEHWQPDSDPHDFPAAADYLLMLSPVTVVDELVARLRKAALIHHKAKDLLRASRLPLLPAKDPEVARDLKKVAHGERLSPVLLVRGDRALNVPLTVADGYHRICASYHLAESERIACRIVDAPGRMQSAKLKPV